MKAQHDWGPLRAELRSVACEDCNAEAGKPCKTSGGNYVDMAHRSRRDAYKARRLAAGKQP